MIREDVGCPGHVARLNFKRRQILVTSRCRKKSWLLAIGQSKQEEATASYGLLMAMPIRTIHSYYICNHTAFYQF